jgi:Flp pilus assembly protein TadG
MRQANSRRGAALAATGLALIVIVPAIGLGVEGSLLYLVRSRMTQAVDAAALAGARSFNSGATLADQRASVVATATKYFYANFPTGFWGATDLTMTPSVTEDNVNHLRTVTVAAVANVPVYFMRVLRPASNSAQVGVTAAAVRRDVNVMLVLDRSQSMVDSHSIDDLQAAAQDFVDQFSGGRDNVGMLTFGGTTYLAYRPSPNFKSDSPNVSTLIGRIRGGGYTNTSQALRLAYNELLTLNQPGALNAVVLFTDGRPTAFTAAFPVRSTSSCQSKTAKTGFLNYSVRGIYNAFATSITDVSENTPAPDSSGCSYSANFNNVANDIARMPALDAYGDATDKGYAGTPTLTSFTQAQIEAASINAADAAAAWIRSDSLHPVIFSIGLGDVDAAFLQRVSNDPSSASYTSAQPAGLFVAAPTSADLAAAFRRIASEVLRLAQ